MKMRHICINPDAVKMHIDVTNRFRSDMQESLMRQTQC